MYFFSLNFEVTFENVNARMGEGNLCVFNNVESCKDIVQAMLLGWDGRGSLDGG